MRLPTDWMREEVQRDLSEDDLVQEIKRRMQIATSDRCISTQKREKQDAI